MKKLLKSISVMALIVFTSASAFAGGLTVPNTFQANTPAKADEVNANFDEVETQVSDNDGRITTNTSNITSNTTGVTGNAVAIAGKQNKIIAAGCAAGSSIRVVNADGSVVCETDDTGSTTASNLVCPSCVGITDIGANSINSSKVVDDSLTAADLAPDSVGASEIRPNSVRSFELFDAPAGVNFSSQKTSGPGNSVTLDSLDRTIRTVSIALPPGKSGFVVANASFNLLGTFGIFGLLDGDTTCNITKNSILSNSQPRIMNEANEQRSQIMSFSQVYSVSSGTTFFRLICHRIGATRGTMRIQMAQLHAIFIPKKY